MVSPPFDNFLVFRGRFFSPSFFYFLGFDIDSGVAVFNQDRWHLFVPEMLYNDAKVLVSDREDVCLHSTFLSKSNYVQLIKQFGQNFSVVLNELNAYTYKRLSSVFSIEDVSAQVQKMRMRKSKKEQDLIKKACAISKSILNNLEPFEFKTEHDLYAYLVYEAHRKADGIAFSPIVASGKNCANPHHRPSDEVIGKEVLVDFGVVVGNYHADFTRMYFSDGADKEWVESYELVKSVVDHVVDHTHSPPVSSFVKQVNAHLNKVLPRGKILHSLGHGVGLEIHERPYLAEQSVEMLCEDMVVAIEPAKYWGDGGVRYEDMFLVKMSGEEVVFERL